MLKNTIIVCMLIVIIALLLTVFSKNRSHITKDESEITPTGTISEEDKHYNNSYLPRSYNREDFMDNFNQPGRYNRYSWRLMAEREFYSQLFFGKWEIIRIVPVEINIPSAYSGFNIDDSFRGQDLVDNIVGQKLFFGGDYVENQGVEYELAEGYKTYSLPLFSEDTIIGCNSAKTLGITSDYFSVVFFIIPHEDRSKEGERDFTSLNQLYLKDYNTMYASVNGCLTFELKRE